ncbi:MAG: Flagellar hook-associated protein [Cyanobacteriota bacterium]|jgi:flagellar hook-associated protein FlgK
MTFGGLYISTSGMLASQVALDVTSNNIANANNEGYTRKTISFQEGSSINAGTSSKLRLLSGVLVDKIERIRNNFLDQQLRQQSSSLGKDEVIADLTIQLNNILGEPSETGLTAKLNDFFKAASDLSASPEQETAKAVFLNSAVALTDSFRQIDQSIYTLENNLTIQPSGELPASIDLLNEKLDTLGKIHGQVLSAQNHGQSISELEDSRDLLMDQISRLMNLKIIKAPDGQFSKLALETHPSEALTKGTNMFTNHDSPITGISAGSNSITLTINNGSGVSTGPFTVNFETNSTIRDVVDKINKTFKAAGGKGAIASLDVDSKLVIQTSMIENALNNSNAEVTISSGTANAILGLTAGTVKGSESVSTEILTSQGLKYKFKLVDGDISAGVNPNKLKLVSNDAFETDLGFVDNPSGTIGGYLTMTNEEIPEMRNLLSDFAMNIKNSVNKLSVLGKTANGNLGEGLFMGSQASNFTVNSNILANNTLFTPSKTGAISDGAVISEIADLFFGTSAIISDGSKSEKIYLDSTTSNYSKSQIPVIPNESIKINIEGLIKNNGSKMNAGTNNVLSSSSLVQIEFIDSNGSVIGSAINFPASQGAPVDKVTYSGTIPAGSAFVRLKMNTSLDTNLGDNEGHFGISIIQGVENDSSNNFNNRMSEVVGNFGTRGNIALSRQSNSQGLLTALETKRQSVSGVSIEEEAANLIRYQNSFAANARVINVWDSIFQAILGMV